MKTVWLDAQLSPRLARWLADAFGVQAAAVRDLGMQQAEDLDIFLAARKAGAVVITKDNDFVELLERLGSPPKIIWLTCGNTSEAALRGIFTANFAEALRLLDADDNLVELGTP
jgi:predicted nuclease of predicted toxin-antitoxin system